MEDILAQFPTKMKEDAQYRSFVYQPERVSVNSRQSLQNPSIIDYAIKTDTYSSFEVQLRTPLMRVKALQLLRASIPNAVPNIPNDECFFFYYRVPVTADPVPQPDFTQYTLNNIYVVYLTPTNLELTPMNCPLVFNKTFQDYDDLATTLTQAAQVNNFRTGTKFIAGDVSFQYDSDLNKMVLIGNNAFVGATWTYAYSPVGYGDPNLALAQAYILNLWNTGVVTFDLEMAGEYTLNRRLGFTFNGAFINPPTNAPSQQSYVLNTTILNIRTVPYFDPPPTPSKNRYTAESYCDLVNTANVFIYCDVVGGSTQDTNSEDRLLAVVPMDASNLGVVLGESKISCSLRKVSDYINNLVFTMRDDKGKLWYLPTNAYINLELKVEYE